MCCRLQFLVNSKPSAIHTPILIQIFLLHFSIIFQFYAPWCGQCKKLEPIYEQLAQKYADDPSVVIAKLDATQNDVDGIEIRSYPSIYFFPANKKRVKGAKKFEGARDLDSLYKYVQKRRSTKKGDAGKDEL